MHVFFHDMFPGAVFFDSYDLDTSSTDMNYFFMRDQALSMVHAVLQGGKRHRALV